MESPASHFSYVCSKIIVQCCLKGCIWDQLYFDQIIIFNQIGTVLRMFILEQTGVQRVNQDLRVNKVHLDQKEMQEKRVT